MANKIIGGDYEGYSIGTNSGGVVILVKSFNIIRLTKEDIQSVELLTEESKKKFLGSAGLGIAGGLLLGPLGLLAGALAGGNKKEICFACHLKDGKKFMAVTDSKVYQKLSSYCF